MCPETFHEKPWCYFRRRDVELQRAAVAFRTVRLVRNQERQTSTDKRLAVRRDVDLQRGRHVSDNHARDHGDGVAAGRQFRVRRAVRHLLLLSLHGPDIRTEGERQHNNDRGVVMLDTRELRLIARVNSTRSPIVRGKGSMA